MRLYSKVKKLFFIFMMINLLGFQPQIKADNKLLSSLALVTCIVAFYNIRGIGNMLGTILSFSGNFLKNITEEKVPEKPKQIKQETRPDSDQYKTAKEAFDKAFLQYKSEQNILWTYNVYQQLHCLTNMDLKTIGIPEGKKSGGMMDFISEQETVASLPRSYLFGDNFCFLGESEKEGKAIIKNINMNEDEMGFYSKFIKPIQFYDSSSKNVSKIEDLKKLINHISSEFQAYRQERAKTLVNICSAVTMCEEGTRKKAKKELLKRKPSEIINVFHSASSIKNNMNSASEKVTEVTKANVLSCCKQLTAH